MNCVSSEYVDDLQQEVVELYTKSRADRSELLQESPTLASGMERPDKAQAVKEHRIRFKGKDDVPVTQSHFYFVKASSIDFRWILFSYPEDSTRRQYDTNVLSHINPAESQQLVVCSIQVAPAQKSAQTYQHYYCYSSK